MPAPIIDGLPEYPQKSYGAKVFNLMATSWNAAIYLMTGQINTALEWINDNFLSIAESKQDTLESGENIKTINSGSLLGSGNISLQVPLISGTNIKTINGSSILGEGNLVIEGGGESVTNGNILSADLFNGGGTSGNLAYGDTIDFVLQTDPSDAVGGLDLATPYHSSFVAGRMFLITGYVYDNNGLTSSSGVQIGIYDGANFGQTITVKASSAVPYNFSGIISVPLEWDDVDQLRLEPIYSAGKFGFVLTSMTPIGAYDFPGVEL